MSAPTPTSIGRRTAQQSIIALLNLSDEEILASFAAAYPDAIFDTPDEYREAIKAYKELLREAI